MPWRCSGCARPARIIVSVEMVAFEWLHGCEHPRFKAVLDLIKRLPF